jgi:hypothetical protein
MKTKKHPILDLVVNENGTEILFEGKKLAINIYNRKGRNYTSRTVHFNNTTQSVAKVVCETWNGMRDDMTMAVHRKDKNPENDFYTNLYWDKRGKVRTRRTSRSSLSKIKQEEIPAILKRINANEPLVNIAKSYNTSDMTIGRIKNKFITNPKLVLKQAVMHAKNKREIATAYAIYFGFKSIPAAVAAYGFYKFNLLQNEIAITL